MSNYLILDNWIIREISYMGKEKRQKKNILKCSIIASVLILSLVAGMWIQNTVKAEEDILFLAECRMEEFISNAYIAKGFGGDDCEMKYSKEMYDGDGNIIAVVGLFSRDEEIDYVIYNCITETIDEYAFDCPEALTRFSEDSTLYYAGALNYYVRTPNEKTMTHVQTKKLIDEKDFKDKADRFVSNIQQRMSKNMFGLGGVDDGEDGIIHWSDLRVDTAGWENSDWNYLDGITFIGSDATDGISGDGLSFSSMNSFSQGGTIRNHCGPTALTNIMVYLDWIGYDTLLNDSREDTFEWMRVMCSHSNDQGTSLSNARTALVHYFTEIGYTDYQLTTFYEDFEDYKDAIDNDEIILTLINVMEEDNDGDGEDDYWGHFVVTLGYEEFRQEYQKQILWWTTTEYNYLRYIRVCDGWGTCNENVYVDLNGFYDNYYNTAIDMN